MRRHVLLVGLSGSGKSTVGALVAERLGAPFVDLDRLVEQRAGRSIARIFEQDGEAAFRAVETALAEEVLSGPASVVAAGGGTFDDPDTRRHALAAAVVVFLETSPRVAAGRLGGTEVRPLLEGAEPAEQLDRMLARRSVAYAEAQQRVTTDDLGVGAVADQVEAIARKWGGW